MTEIETINFIQNSYLTISKQEDFSPKNECLNKTLNQLVLKLIKKNKNTENFCSSILLRIKSTIEPLREICQNAECQMEDFWTEKFISKENLRFKDLKSFWYFEQYKQITLNELNLLKSISNIQNIAFVGSGPLPMTAMILKKDTDYQIDLVDKNKKAIQLSKKLCEKLNLTMGFFCKEASEIGYEKYDVVFVASMIDDKISLIDKLYEDKVPYIVVREAEKFSQIFYKKIETEIFKKYEIVGYVAGDDLTLNSSLLLKRKG